jgi:hypothetical protein
VEAMREQWKSEWRARHGGRHGRHGEHRDKDDDSKDG